MSPEVFRNAMISLYGNDGYVSKFATRIGRRRQTIYKWLNGELPIPIWATQLLTFLIREQKQKDAENGTT